MYVNLMYTVYRIHFNIKCYILGRVVDMLVHGTTIPSWDLVLTMKLKKASKEHRKPHKSTNEAKQ